MSLRNIVAFLFILLSLGLLYPGLTMAMMTITVHGNLPILGDFKLYEATQSIVQTIRSLFLANNNLVAWLILIFSIVIPVAKAATLLVVLLFRRLAYRKYLYKFVALIGKWSMADVFVVSVMLAYLSTHSYDNVTAVLHNGFYYFTAYCITSILGTQIMDIKALDEEEFGFMQDL